MKKIKIAISGIGNRTLPKKVEGSNWHGWAELIKRSDKFELVAAHDVSDEAIARLTGRGYLKPEQTYKDFEAMLKCVECESLLVTNPAEYHAPTIKLALKYGRNILVEKPFVNDAKDGNELLGAIDRAHVKVSVVQNWRTKDVGRIIHDFINKGSLGRIGHVFFRYVRNRENPNYPAYIFEEKFPLLYAMGIHHLDLFRYILNDEFATVAGSSFRPPWSMYKSDTGVTLNLKMKSGIPVIYTGTISSMNRSIPQESLVIEGEKGTIVNESDWSEPPLWFYPAGSKERVDLALGVKGLSVSEQYNISDQRLLDNFYETVVGNEKAICDAGDALKSVYALELSVKACQTGEIQSF